MIEEKQVFEEFFLEETYYDGYIIYGIISNHSGYRIAHLLNTQLRLHLYRSIKEDKIKELPTKKKKKKIIQDLFSDIENTTTDEENNSIRYEVYIDNSDSKRFITHLFQNHHQHTSLIKEMKSYDFIMVINDFNRCFPTDLLEKCFSNSELIQLAQRVDKENKSWLNFHF